MTDRRHFLRHAALLGGAALLRAAEIRAADAATEMNGVRGGVFLATEPPEIGRGIPAALGMKHVTPCFHPPSGRVYFTGGDYPGLPPYTTDSYRQETWSLDVAARLSGNRNAGWRLEYPYAGYGGSSVQPKNPDYVGFVWDAKRNVFWMVPGTMEVVSGTRPPGETTKRGDDPGFIQSDVMTFDPSAAPAQRWQKTGAGTSHADYSSGIDSWFVILDPVKDGIYRIGAGPRLQTLDLNTRKWSKPFNLPDNSKGRKPSIWKEYFAWDEPGRCFYVIDPIDGLFLRIDVDTWKFAELSAAPGALETPRDTNHTHLVFNSKHRVVEYLNIVDGHFYVWDVAGAAWSDRGKPASEPPGRTVTARCAVYDPAHDVSLWFGGVEPANPWIFVYRQPNRETAAAALPAWLRGKPLNEWIQVPATRQIDSRDVLNDLVAAGYTNNRWDDTGWGESPRNGTFAFGGGALRVADSTLLSFGGGGATWAGNEVRALRLADDAPRWFCAVKPSKVAGVWPKAARNSSAYNPDGTPISRHSYWQPQFNNARNEFMAFGAQNVWSADKGTYYHLDAVPLATGVWHPRGTYGDQHPFPRYDGAWACKHPVTEDVYCATSHYIQVWNAQTGRWGSAVIDTSWVDLDRGCAAVDPVRNRIFRIGPKPGRGTDAPGYIDIAARTDVDVTCTGLTSALQRSSGAGLVWDAGIGKFVFFTDLGELHTIDPVSWNVAKLPVTGSPPAPYGAGVNGGDTAIHGRMQYVPKLKGIVIAQAFDRNVYFVKTSA